MTFTNQGSTDAPGGYWVALYLAGSLIAAEYVYEVTPIDALIEYSWDIEIPDLKTGTYTLEAVVDIDEDVMELDETNNSLSKSVKIN
jgi:subtilase family serine protease